MNMPTPLVSTQWLADNLAEPGLRIFDTTLYLRPKPEGFGYMPESGKDEWVSEHIPGAGFLDVPSTGDYAFSTASDDGSRLWIDEELVVANDGHHGVMGQKGRETTPAMREFFKKHLRGR